MPKALLATAILTALAMASPAAAQGDYTAGNWGIAERPQHCAAFSFFGAEDNRTEFSFEINLDGQLEMRLLNGGWSAESGQNYEISLGFAAASPSAPATNVQRQARGVSAGGKKGFRIYLDDAPGAAPADFRGLIARSARLTLHLAGPSGRTLIGAYSLAGSTAAMRALQDCASRAKARAEASAPRDPFAAATPPAPSAPAPPIVSRAAAPAGNATEWISADDLTPEEKAAGVSGTTAVTLRVGADGRPFDCQITMSSGRPWLDQKACTLILRRGRFRPATDSNGNAIEGSYTQRVRWG